jgi:hypothetical protein
VNDDRTARRLTDLSRPEGTGPLWGITSSDLNATLLVWPAGHEVAEHTNNEALIDGQQHSLSPGHALLIPKGSSRAIEAGATGVRYLSVHRRRGPLQIEGLPSPVN